MRQDTLFPLPPDRKKAQHEQRADKLRGFMNAHAIITHRAPIMIYPWTAMIRFEEDRLADKSLAQCMAESARLYEECGMIAFGQSERQAVVNLCLRHGIKYHDFL